MSTSTYLPSPPPSSWPSIDITSHLDEETYASMVEKLRHSVTFLPLKDLRYSALQRNTWFMNSMNDVEEEGEVQYQKYPSEASKGRILCVKGHDTHDGSWNYYALAWLKALPYNATLMKGLTFVSYNHYDYHNLWHGLSAVFPFVGWHMKNGCKVPSRWVLYHWGELRSSMALWLRLILEATFGEHVNIEVFEGADDNQSICFEEAVVIRHDEAGGLSKERRMETFDLLRCKARAFCNVTLRDNTKYSSEIGMTLLMRTGARSFKNESSVVDIFRRECAKVQRCRLTIAHSENLTFCEQVQLMSSTGILVSPHGAQLTNLFLMNKNSSVMEFFPKGWLKLAGRGQFVFHWMASWSGMIHQGAYHDDPSTGDHVSPYQANDKLFMSLFKDGKIRTNETYFREWSRLVLNEVRIMKINEGMATHRSMNKDCSCESRYA